MKQELKENIVCVPPTDGTPACKEPLLLQKLRNPHSRIVSCFRSWQKRLSGYSLFFKEISDLQLVHCCKKTFRYQG